MPHHLIQREVGSAQDSIVLLVIEPADEPMAAAPDRGAGNGPEYVDTSKHLADALAAAQKGGAPALHAIVVVDGDELELLHDQPEVLADFVECVYVLHGWKALTAIALDLEQMLLYAENPRRYELSTQAAESLSGGTPSPEQRSAYGNLVDPAGRARLLSLRRRTGSAFIPQIREWQAAYGEACNQLRLRVLRVARAFEERALDRARVRLSRNMDTTVDEAIQYFQWEKRDAAAGALRGLANPSLQAKLDGVRRLRARLEELEPFARKVTEGKEKLGSYDGMSQHGPPPEPYATEQKQATRALEQALAAYGARLGVIAQEFPVLYRFDVDTVLEAAAAPDTALGSLLFKRLKKTFLAAERLWPELHEHRPAKAASEDEIQRGALPELVIGGTAEDSVWSYPRIIEATVPLVPIEDAELVECMVLNIGSVMRGQAEAESGMALVKGMGLVGLTLGLMYVCPPAGVALELGMAIADIKHSADEFGTLSDASLCALDPREAFSEIEPSSFPLVLAVAGAALVAIR